MALLSSEQLTQIRTQATASLDQTCTVSTPGAESIDAAGGTTQAAPSTASVSCRVATPNGSDQKIAERLGVVIDAMVTVPHGTSVDREATIIVSGGGTYEVVIPNDDQSWKTAVRVGCRRVA
jgi:SPP1 family predicted phage head-tail adaptor